MPNGAQTRTLLLSYLLARIPLVVVRTVERGRVEETLTELSGEKQLDILAHSLSEGLRDLRTGRQEIDDTSLWGALHHTAGLFKSRQNLTVVFSDVQGISEDNEVTRYLRDLATLAERRGGSIVLITADPVWTPLQSLGMGVTLDVPDTDEMRRGIQDFLATLQHHHVRWGEAEYEQATAILAGVTKGQAINILSTLAVRGPLDAAALPLLSEAKDAMFSDLAGVERVVPRPTDHQVGGLAGLRAWLDAKRPLLTRDLRDRGLRPPRGVLLLGVPGCGKSLSAKAVAASWQLPLYRLDMAAILGQYVGQSENRLRAALASAESVAPCILWIDEIEKGFAGAGTETTGVTMRLVGQFLYWLQESAARVFVVATANDVTQLPQELLRNGRFDAVFFVDLPTPDERREIIELYLRRCLKVPVATGTVDDLVLLSDGFTGADIQTAVADIAEQAMRVGDDRLVAEDFRNGFRGVTPLSRTSPDRVEEIRKLRDRAKPAAGAPAGSAGVSAGGRGAGGRMRGLDG